MKMKDNFIVAMICFGIILYHSLINESILNNSYMILLFWILFGVGGYHMGCGLGKMFK